MDSVSNNILFKIENEPRGHAPIRLQIDWSNLSAPRIQFSGNTGTSSEHQQQGLHASFANSCYMSIPPTSAISPNFILDQGNFLASNLASPSITGMLDPQLTHAYCLCMPPTPAVSPGFIQQYCTPGNKPLGQQSNHQHQPKTRRVKTSRRASHQKPYNREMTQGPKPSSTEDTYIEALLRGIRASMGSNVIPTEEVEPLPVLTPDDLLDLSF